MKASKAVYQAKFVSEIYIFADVSRTDDQKLEVFKIEKSEQIKTNQDMVNST